MTNETPMTIRELESHIHRLEHREKELKARKASLEREEERLVEEWLELKKQSNHLIGVLYVDTEDASIDPVVKSPATVLGVVDALSYRICINTIGTLRDLDYSVPPDTNNQELIK